MMRKVENGLRWMGESLEKVRGAPVVLKPEVHRDGRGYFVETFNERDFHEALGSKVGAFVQDNESMSAMGTFRGLHYQIGNPGQAKLVRVSSGAAYDFVMDVREGSPTFGEWGVACLNHESKWQMYIPAGFAHGFLATGQPTVFSYKVDCYREKENERGVRWDDPEIGIEEWLMAGHWSRKEGMSLSKRDMALPTLGSCEPSPTA